MKHCSGCGQDKPITEFWINRKRGRPMSRCKVCSLARARAWRISRPNYERDRYQLVKVETRERHLIRKYGVSLSDYDRMLSEQDHRCAICQTTTDTQHNKVLHVDHCHVTGAVRGLLCRGCNHLLGSIKDNPSSLVRAIIYLGVKNEQIPELIDKAIMAHESRIRTTAS